MFLMDYTKCAYIDLIPHVMEGVVYSAAWVYLNLFFEGIV